MKFFFRKLREEMLAITSDTIPGILELRREGIQFKSNTLRDAISNFYRVYNHNCNTQEQEKPAIFTTEWVQFRQKAAHFNRMTK
jgi:hypothetical protein